MIYKAELAGRPSYTLIVEDTMAGRRAALFIGRKHRVTDELPLILLTEPDWLVHQLRDLTGFKAMTGYQQTKLVRFLTTTLKNFNTP